MLKVDPHPDYPPEDGRYLRGNDFSPVAVAIILNCDADKIPPELENLVRAGIETGAALSGTVQTENVGFEKIVCNIVSAIKNMACIYANPQILVVFNSVNNCTKLLKTSSDFGALSCHSFKNHKRCFVSRKYFI